MDQHRKPKKETAAFSRVALDYLRKAEWTQGRVVPTSLYEEAYASEGLCLLPTARRFLRGFGGLIIRYESRSHQEDILEFLADRAVLGMKGRGIASFEELIGVAPLCPIGHYLFGTCMLFMDGRGRVYGGSDEIITLVGKTGEEAVGNILTGAESEILEARTA
jgi:SUKH-3 immunity protein